jgi:hypothetical protein
LLSDFTHLTEKPPKIELTFAPSPSSKGGKKDAFKQEQEVYERPEPP